jgi:hypothetical protein
VSGFNYKGEGSDEGTWEGVVPSVNFWFSSYCASMIACGKISNAAHISGNCHIFFILALLYTFGY